MRSKWQRVFRGLAWLASGAVVLQAAGCDTVLQVMQTGFLAALTGITFFLARYV